MHNIGKVDQDPHPQPNAEENDSRESPIQIDNTIFDRYEIVSMVGTGRFSQVFKAMNIETNELVAIKVLKQMCQVVRIQKVQQEITMLLALPQSEFIAKLQGRCYHEISKKHCLVFPFVEHTDIRELKRSKLKLSRIRTYVSKVLQALRAVHEVNIMHRDVKPLNILYNPDTEQVVLTDWGVAEFYTPGTDYKLKVGSLYFKSPQLLLNCTRYDCSIDIWSLGCVLAGLVFSKHIFFEGDSNLDQLHRIVQCVGTADALSYIEHNRLVPSQDVTELLAKNQYDRKQWSAFFTKKSRRKNSKNALDLLSRMLVIDPRGRITARDALNHPFFHEN